MHLPKGATLSILSPRGPSLSDDTRRSPSHLDFMGPVTEYSPATRLYPRPSVAS